MRAPARAAAVAAAIALAAAAQGYPIDAYEQTGIGRLEAYRLAQEGVIPGRLLYWGAQLYTSEIRLRLADRPAFAIPEPDPDFTARLAEILGSEADAYGVAVLDLTDPARPRYAAHNADQLQNPGSVGKIAVALAWFQALADVYPDDIEARKKILREAQITADDFIRVDTHVVPFWTPGALRYVKRPIELGDTANVWTWLDWMCSSSSNAAAAMLQSHLILLTRFGAAYPVPDEEAERFFRETPKAELGAIFRKAIVDPLARSGLDPEKLRQGSFFTRTGKNRVPGISSHASSAELLRYVVRMEQGKLVDPWSSLEIKKLLYLTDRRIRYASAPVLRNFAVYFKSGSLYSCRPEPGFECKKYHGNRRNFMNSVTAVEGVEEHKDLHYAAVVLSNVLRKNSAVVHQTLGTRIHQLIVAYHEERKQREAASEEGGLSSAPSGDGATTSQTRSRPEPR